jgi:putative PIG3 family NAD(P)H quinone oxidoreductase
MDMKAILITKKGGPEVLELHEVATPVPAAGEVLIKIKAAGLNRSDVYSRSSQSYGGRKDGTDAAGGEIPGLEIAGHIESCGPEVRRWKKGDAVCALVTGGGYAQYIAVPEGQCLPVPERITLEEAASLPETIFTVWLNVFRTARLQAGENLLVHGGSSGIGVTAIQLATAFGANIFTTAGTDEKCRWCESLGATKAVNYKTEDFEKELKDIGIDVILDMTGGDFTLKNIRLLREEGRIVFINAIRGNESPINIADIMRKRLVLTGSMLKPRDAAFKAALAAEVEKNVWPLIARGAVKPITYKILPLEEAATAQRLMESSEHTGKILLRVY